MNDQSLCALLDSLSNNLNSKEHLNRPSSPPCNSFSASILSLQSQEYDPEHPYNEEKSSSLAYSPTRPVYSPTRLSPIGTLPALRGTTDEKFESMLIYFDKAIRKLTDRVEKHEITITKLQEQLERRYIRHNNCINELQEKVYKSGSIHRKRRRDEESPVTYIDENREQIQNLQNLQNLQQLQQLQQLLQVQPVAPLDYQSLTFHQHPQPQVIIPSQSYEPHEIKELRIKEAIGQFLRSWNRNYRCSHHFREGCKFKDSECYRIHENSKHSVIARELRTVLLDNGNTDISSFFAELVSNVQEKNYHCSETLESLRNELITLSRTINQ